MKSLSIHLYRMKRNRGGTFTDYTDLHFLIRRSYIHMPIVKLSDGIKFSVYNIIRGAKNVYDSYKHTVDDFAFYIDSLDDVDNKRVHPPLSMYVYTKEHSLCGLYEFTSNKKMSDYQKGK